MITITGDIVYHNGQPVALIIARPGTNRDAFTETVLGSDGVHEALEQAYLLTGCVDQGAEPILDHLIALLGG